MRVEIVTPQTLATTVEDAKHVQLPGMDGKFGVLDNHMPLISTLQEDELVIVDLNDGGQQQFKIGKGFTEITSDSVTILVERVEPIAS